MTPEYLAPGVYIEEIPCNTWPIEGVTTSITAFIGRALRGLDNEPVHIRRFDDYERLFGGVVARKHDELCRIPLLPKRW